MAAEPLGEAAPAKVNLYLHIRGRRADGYHLLESLAVFPSVGDYIEAEPAPGLGLSITGPFANTLPISEDNLVLRAASGLARRRGLSSGAALRLTKNLPVASGIGGGSSDAAAALRLLARVWDTSVPEELALSLGADVPVCMSPKPQFMEGIGEKVRTCANFPPLWIVLVNPLVSVSTGAVFNALRQRDNPPGPKAPQGGFAEASSLIAWLKEQRNDLQEAACALCPPITEALRALTPAPLARMSGSGATCFALFDRKNDAEKLAVEIRSRRANWWVAMAPISQSGDAP